MPNIYSYSIEVNHEASYVTYTRCLFAFTETVAIAKLLDLGESIESIKYQVLQGDLLQIRSIASRQSSLRIILKRLNLLSERYIHFIATANIDLQQFTIYWAILLEHRLLREFIREVLIEKLYYLDRKVSDRDIKEFFATKYEQHEEIRNWSQTTFHKTARNVVGTFVKVGLLYPIQNRKSYEIRPNPIPAALRTQLLADGFEHYLILMLDFDQVTERALNTASIGSV